MEMAKKVHYCWFGGNSLPKLSKKCIASWKKFMPDYEIIEWNESNFNLECCDYVKEAFSAKKWAFISDYARFWILYNYGGLYFDTDVELIAPIDDIISRGSFMGLETVGVVAPGLGIGSEPVNWLYKEILDYYNSIKFFKYPGVPNEGNVVSITTNILIKHGFDVSDNSIQNIEGINIYPAEYFCPLDYLTGELRKTENTRSIHHYMGSWIDPLERFIIEIEDKHRLGRLYSLPYRIHNKVKKLGLKGTLKFGVWKIRKIFKKE